MQATKKLFFLAVSECAFFHHTNSPVYICTFFLFFSKSISRLYLLPLIQYLLTLYATALVVVSFFSWCAFEGRKSFSLTKKRANIFLSCTSSVFWITDIFFLHHQHHHLPMQCRRVFEGGFGNVRVLREFFVYFSFLCTKTFFVF